MAGRDRYQIVFLVDLSAGVPLDDTDASADQIAPCICLSALRILTHLTSQVPDTASGRSHVKWGFKFYNSLSRNIQKYKFYEFTAKDFEEFETQVDTVIESEKTKSHGLVKNRFERNVSFGESEHSEDRAVNQHVVHEEFTDPVDKLQNALRDLVTDFQWDRPDITSPVRSAPRRSNLGRKRSILDDQEPRQQNLTFLFSRCPHSPSTLASFAGVAEDADPQDILSSFLPTSLYRQFYESSKIRLFWVDLNADPSAVKGMLDKEFSVHGINQMHEALSQVGGGVLPVNSILQMGTHSNTLIQRLLHDPIPSAATPTDLQTFLTGDCRAGGLVLPTSSLLRWYLHDPFRGPLVQPSVTTADLVVESGCHHQALGQVEIRQLTIPKETEKKRSSLSGRAKKPYCYNVEIIETGEPEATANGGLALSVKGPTPSDSVTSAQPPVTNVSSLRVRGTVSSCDLPLDYLQSDSVFTVKVSSDELSVHFPRLLQELARSRLCLLVDYEYKSLSLLRVGVLQPLTSVLATLTLLRSDVTLNAEKILAFSDEVRSASDGVDFKNVGVKGFIAKSIKHLWSVGTSGMGYEEKTNSDGAVPTTGFHVNVVEGWMTGAVCGANTDQLIQSLHNSEEHEQVEAAEVHALRSVQKLYHEAKYCRHSTRASVSTPKKKVPSSPRRTPRKSPRKTPRKSPRKSVHSALRRTPRKTPNKKKGGKSKAAAKVSAAGLGRSRSFTAPHSRTAMIMQRSQQVAAQTEEDDQEDRHTDRDAVPASRPNTRSTAAMVAPERDFESEADLVEYLSTHYNNGVSGDTSALSCAQALLNVTLHYLKSSGTEEPEKATEVLFRRDLLKTTGQIKEKYAAGGGDDEARLREYHLQVLLYLELESLLVVTARTEEDQTPTVEQVSSMLTRMTLLKDPAYVSTFMKGVLIDNYVETTPRLLANIYEELLLPLPPQLAGLFSGSEDESSTRVSSVQPPSVRSDLGSATSSAGNPGSNRSMRNRRSIGTIPSFNVATKRQIAIPTKAKKTDKDPKEKKKVKRSGRAASAKKLKQSAGPKSEVKQVRRNLFMGDPSKAQGKLERHRSVAVMESTQKPPTTPNKRIQKSLQTTPKAHHILKTKKVTETPVHKQVQQVMWRRLEKERQRSHTVSDVHVVQESPDKAPPKGLKTSLPRRSSLANVRRKSFYSDGPQMESRNVRKYKQLEARMTNVNPLASPGEKPVPKTSPPRRIRPVNLFANLNSPSPPKVVHRQQAPAPSNAVVKMNFGLDSPSKNTRTRSLFAPPEIDRPDTPPKKRMSLQFDSVGQGTQPTRTSPRRIALQGCFMSPQKSASYQGPFMSPPKNLPKSSFMSPVKSSPVPGLPRPGLSTPVKSHEPTTPLKTIGLATPDRRRNVLSPDPVTPRRSQRILCPSTPDPKTGHNTPRKGSPQKRVVSPEAGFQSPTRDRKDMLEKWAQKALRHTPQRQARGLCQSMAEFGSQDDSVPVGDLGLMSPPRKRDSAQRRRTPRARRLIPDEEETDVKNDDLRETLSLRKSPMFSPDKPSEVLLSPSRCTRSLSASMSEMGQGNAAVVSPTKLEVDRPDSCHSSKRGDPNSFTPPAVKPQKSAADVTPSRKFKAGRITPEPTSPLDSWPRRKPRSTLTPSKVSAKLENLMDRVLDKARGSTSTDSSMGQGVKTSQSHCGERLGSVPGGTVSQTETNSGLESGSLFSSQSAGGGSERGLSGRGTPRSHGDSTGSTPASKRKLSLRQTETTDTYCPDNPGTPSKRRRLLRHRSTLSSAQAEESSLEYFDTAEVFLPALSTTSSTKENSPTRGDQYPAGPANPLRGRGRLLRGCSAGSESNSNLDPSLPASPEIAPTNKLLQRVGVMPSEGSSDQDPSLPASPVFSRSAERLVNADSMSPTSGGRTPTSVKGFSPSISAMSLVHLMQSPLVDNSSSSPGNNNASGTRQAKSSRRSLYRTSTNMEDR